MTAWLEFGLSNAIAATALAVVAFLVTRVTRRPHVAFAVWMLVLAKLVTPPLVSLPLPTLWTPQEVAIVEPTSEPLLPLAAPQASPRLVFDQPAAAHAQASASMAPTSLDRTPADRLATKLSPAAILVAVWLAVSLLWLALAVARVLRFVRVLARAQRASVALTQEVAALAAQLGLRRPPQVKLVERRVSPLVWAFAWRPVILLPAELLTILSPRERETLLVHELVHLVRRDHLARLVELAALCLFWWHPVAWWARRHAERAAEQCCDAAVVAHLPGAATAYARTLLTTVDFLSDAPHQLPLAASGFSQVTHVKRRMEMILTAQPTHTNRPARLALLALALLVLPLSLRALWAEPAEAPAEATAPTVLEQRLDRLERMIEKLADKVDGNAAAPTAAQPETTPSETAPSAAIPLSDEQLTALESELIKAIREATIKLEMTKTNYNREQAADKQMTAVRKAYADGALTMDQLLEAQRRLAEAEASRVRTSCELISDPVRRQYVYAALSLGIANRAQADARRTWDDARKIPDKTEARMRAEAQSREQFHQFQAQVEAAQRELGHAEEAQRAHGR